MNYRVYGLTLGSALPLPELCPVPDPDAALTVEMVAEPVTNDGWRWDLSQRGPTGEPWLTIGVRDGAYLLRFSEGPDFVVSADGRTIACHAAPDMPLDTIRHVLVDHVIPQLLSHMGRLVLHASACLAGGGAVAFLGPTGAGKSTLAAALAGGGSPLLADDALVVDSDGGQMTATPAYPGVRVWPDVLPALGNPGAAAPVAHYTDKCRVGHDEFAFLDHPVALRRVYLLAGPDDMPAATIEISPMTSRDRAMALIHHSYIMDPGDRARLAAKLDRVSREGGSIDMRRLDYPRDLSTLPRVRAAILADLDAA